MTEFTTVARVGEIPENRGITVAVAGRLVAAFNVDGEDCAIDDLCPHMGAAVGTDEAYRGAVACPWHAWRFDIRTGTWCDNPKLKVDVFETRVVGDEIQVRVPPKS